MIVAIVCARGTGRGLHKPNQSTRTNNSPRCAAEDGAEAVDQKRARGRGGRRDFAWGSRRGAHLKQASWVDAPPVPIPGPTELGLGMPPRPLPRDGELAPRKKTDLCK